MKEYVLRNRRTNEIITLKRNDLTAGQMKEIRRDGYEICYYCSFFAFFILT